MLYRHYIDSVAILKNNLLILKIFSIDTASIIQRQLNESLLIFKQLSTVNIAII